MRNFMVISIGGVISLTLATLSYAQVAVDSVTYTGVGGTGSYDDVTFMGSGDSSECTKAKREYSGPMAPFNEDLSLQFRGPLNLKQFAVYYPISSPAKRSNGWESFYRSSRRHAHYHKRDGTSYTRAAYFNSVDGTSNGLTFMNTNGGSGSGVWSSAFGNSLSFSNADNSGAASESTCLKDITLDSDEQFNIFSDQQCDEVTCGYTREGVPSYKGFSGGDKVFMFEFSMPKASPGSSNNYDMPAIWALNGRITRMSQWSTCSCWDSGCGEFDIFEAISSDTADKLITHIHNNQGALAGSKGGSGSDGQFYFERPISNSMKAAVVFTSDGTIDIHVLDGGVNFSETLDTGSIKSSGSNIVEMPA